MGSSCRLRPRRCDVRRLGSMGVMQNVMLADAVDYGEWRTGERNEGVIFSMLTFLSKVAAGLSSLITMLGFAAVWL